MFLCSRNNRTFFLSNGTGGSQFFLDQHRGGESQILLDQHRERAGGHEFFWVKLVGGHEYFSDFVKNYSISLSVLWDLMTEYGGEKTSTVICFTMGCLKECFLGLFRYIIFLYIFSSFNLS